MIALVYNNVVRKTPYPHYYGVLRSSGSNSVTTKFNVPGGAPLHCNAGKVLSPVQPEALAV